MVVSHLQAAGGGCEPARNDAAPLDGSAPTPRTGFKAVGQFKPRFTEAFEQPVKGLPVGRSRAARQ
jgi:hypothetical protein